MPDSTKDTTEREAALVVSLDKQTIDSLVTEAVTRGIADGVKSWQTQQAISEAADAAIRGANLPELVAASLARRMDTAAEGIAEDVAEAIVEGLKLATREIAVEIAAKVAVGIERRSFYGEDEGALRTAKDRVRKALTGGAQ